MTPLTLRLIPLPRKTISLPVHICNLCRINKCRLPASSSLLLLIPRPLNPMLNYTASHSSQSPSASPHRLNGEHSRTISLRTQVATRDAIPAGASTAKHMQWGKAKPTAKWRPSCMEASDFFRSPPERPMARGAPPANLIKLLPVLTL